MPIYRMGKLREALTINSELYKKKAIRYLDSRGFYVKASSDVEATFADCVLSKKGEDRDFWLEAKATTVSLGETAFLSQLGKYLTSYLSRTPQKRFKMILVCYKLTNTKLFNQVFEGLEPEAIDNLIQKMVAATDSELRPIILNAKPEAIKQFFEESTIIEADIRDLQVAEEKIQPKPPTRPQLSDADYAAQILDSFGDIEPIKESEEIWLNLFELELPEWLYEATTKYPSAKLMFEEKPDVSFPIFEMQNANIYSFIKPLESVLSQFVDAKTVKSVKLEDFASDPENVRTIIILVNRWIKQRCRKKGLTFDNRSKAYFFTKNADNDDPIIVQWKPRLKQSERELTKPIKRNERIRYWVHRASVISARNIWGKFYIQIRTRFLFSPDGLTLYDGEKIDTLDRSYRKSIYSRNLNQLYDVLFWYKHVFPEADTKGNVSLENYIGEQIEHQIRVGEQVHLTGEVKPNIEIVEEVEKFERIEEAEETTTLFDFMEEEEL